MEFRTIPVSRLDPWEKNPREISVQDYERLKWQIRRLEFYKPLIVEPAPGGRFIVLGGNSRLAVLKELRAKQAGVSIVHPKSEAERLEYAISDNDLIGKYDTEKLARLILPVKDEIPLENYRIPVGEPKTIPELKREFGQSLDIREKELDEGIKTAHACRECGYKW